MSLLSDTKRILSSHEVIPITEEIETEIKEWLFKIKF
jgi:hypothetical protein